MTHLTIYTIRCFTALIVSGLLFVSCTPQKLSVEQLAKVIELKKEPCFGDCPVYTLTFYENGIVQYLGKENVSKQGTHLKKMNINDLRKLVKTFEEANFFDFNNMYRAEYPDLQTVAITFNHDGRSKTVIGKSEGRPDALLELEAKLDAIGNSEDGWKPQEDASTSGNSPVANQIIVQVLQNTNMEEWITRFAGQGVNIVESLSPNGTYWLLDFNTDATTTERMIEIFRNDDRVISAEVNRPVDFK